MPFRGNIQTALPLFPYKSRGGSGWNRCQKVKRTTTFSTLNLKLLFTAGETTFFNFYSFFTSWQWRGMTYPSSSAQSGAGICVLVFHILPPPPPLGLCRQSESAGLRISDCRAGIQRMGGPESNLWSESEVCSLSGLSGGLCSVWRRARSVQPCTVF